MTGFGKGEATLQNKKITVEIRSLNSKQLDLGLRLPAVYRQSEYEIRNIITRTVLRGKVDVFVTVESQTVETPARINKEVFAAYAGQLRDAARNAQLNYAGIGWDSAALQAIMRLPEVVSTEAESISDEEHAAQPETAQHERRQHDGRRGNHHVPDDHPVRDGERDAEALRQLGQGDVHHALPERGREGARQQHGQHAGRAFPELARLSHPTAFPRSRTRPPPALASGRSIQCSDAVEAGSPAFRTRNAPVAKPMHGRRGAALASPLGFFR